MCQKHCLLILAVLGLAEPLPERNSNKTEKYDITSSECPPLFEILNNGCYYFSDVRKNFNEAATYCESLGHGHAYEITLAMLDYDRDEDQALLNAVSVKNTTHWVGGKNVDGEWQWIDGRIVYSHSLLWEYYEPNRDGNDCMAAESVRIGHGTHTRSYLYDHMCSDSLNFICQTGNIKCPVDFIKIGNYCYLQSWIIGLPMLSWQDSRDYCQTLEVYDGYHVDLAMFGLEDQDDDQAMYILVGNYSGYTVAGVYIGAHRPSTECYWQWLDGRELSLESISWRTDQPDCGSSDNIGYLHYSYWHNRAYIADNPDYQSRSFICQMFKDA